MKKATLFGLGLAALLTACQSNNDAALLKFNLEKGKQYSYGMDMDMKNEAQGQKMSTTAGFDYSMQVLDDAGSVKTIKTTFDRIAMKLAAGPTQFNYDSNTPPRDTAVDLQSNPMAIMGKMFGAMKGQSFEMKVTDKGEITQITGLREMAQAMTQSVASDEHMRASMDQVFQSQFNEEAMKKSFSQSFNIYPDKPVKVGDTWQKTVQMGGGVPTTATTTYKVKDITADKVILDASSDLTVNGTAGKQTGTMEVDRKSGLVLNGKLEQRFGAPLNLETTVSIRGKEQ